VQSHLLNARQMRQARSALDAFGQATIAVHPGTGRITWQTPLARQLLDSYFNGEHERAPQSVLDWIGSSATQHRNDPGAPQIPLNIIQASRRLSFALHDRTADGEWLLVLREENDAAQIEALISHFTLTRREAEVLYWVIKGKTSPDIGEILGSSPRTVNKHLEHIYEKLGVENRTAAANLALSRLRPFGTGD
jgi:DNA-binding CsgD family transcriptional regulator